MRLLPLLLLLSVCSLQLAASDDDKCKEGQCDTGSAVTDSPARELLQLLQEKLGNPSKETANCENNCCEKKSCSRPCNEWDELWKLLIKLVREKTQDCCTPPPTDPPTPVPTEPPTTKPTEPPTTRATVPPTPKPTDPPTPKPTDPPTPMPTDPQTTKPTEPPTTIPTEPSTARPTAPPTPEPTNPPTTKPTEPPTTKATVSPTPTPTDPPTTKPTAPPTAKTCKTTTERPISSTNPEPHHCPAETCKLPQCNCPSPNPPINNMPQFVMLSFGDAVTRQNMPFYRELLVDTRRKNNASGCNIAATFFVSAEYAEYPLVNELYAAGNEIALHSIRHLMVDMAR